MNIWIFVLLLCILLLCSWIFFWVLIPLFTWCFTNPPSVPTNKRSRNTMLDLLEKHTIMPSDGTIRIYDLGSGFGNLAFAAKRRFPHANIIGYEHFWFPYLIARFKLFFCFSKTIQFRYDSFYHANLSDADVVLTFLFPTHHKKLAPQYAQLPKGTPIISNNFRIPEKEPVETVILKDWLGAKRMIYLYKA